MTTRKGINISGRCVVPINATGICLFIHVLCILKNKRSDKIVFYVVFETQRPSDTVF